MFSFSKRRTKLGRVKKVVQLSDSISTPVSRSPIRPHKRVPNPNLRNGSLATTTHCDDDQLDCQCQAAAQPADIGSSTSGNSEKWMVLSIAGDKPSPRFNHAATVIGNKMIVVGGESGGGSGLLDDVQVLSFDNFTWTTVSSKLYLSSTSLPLKIPACKGHSLVSWGKKALLIGGKTDAPIERLSVLCFGMCLVWAFDTETQCWSLMEAKGDIPIARSGHTVVRSSSTLILFGGEDIKKRKLNDLHMFDLKSLTWLPLHCTGTGPSPRSNHVAALCGDKMLFVFGGASKSRTLNDLYSLNFETMVWSRIKIRGFHPSPRAGCCGVLCGTKWYITGGGSRKKRHSETLIFDVQKVEWSVAFASPASSIATNKGFSLVLVQHKEKDFLVTFGGSKKEPSNQVEVMLLEKHESDAGQRAVAPDKGLGSLAFEKHTSSTGVGDATQRSVDSVGRQSLASAIEQHGSGRMSLSESSLMGTEQPDTVIRTHNQLGKIIHEDDCRVHSSECSISHSQGSSSDNERVAVPEETDSSAYQLYEAKLAALIKKNGVLEGQFTTALAGREAAEKSFSAAVKSKQDMERKLVDATREVELLKEKLSSLELAHQEANDLSNLVHSDNVRLEHDVAFLKAVFDDTQKELHSTRGVLAGERARAFQLQVEVFHLKQRLQSLENRAPSPRKPYHV
ncbi:Acyl-CoA-binding domain-containing protein 6 [Linum grandiflorum]